MSTAREGLALSGRIDPEVEAALLRETVRCELLSLGPQPDHGGLLERADALASAIGRGRGAQLTVAGLYAYFTGVGSAGALWDEGRSAAEAEGDVDSLMRCSNNLISWHEGDGDPEVALLLSEQMAQVAAAHGLGEWRAQFMAMAANLHFHQGTYPAALALAGRHRCCRHRRPDAPAGGRDEAGRPDRPRPAGGRRATDAVTIRRGAARLAARRHRRVPSRRACVLVGRPAICPRD